MATSREIQRCGSANEAAFADAILHTTKAEFDPNLPLPKGEVYNGRVDTVTLTPGGVSGNSGELHDGFHPRMTSGIIVFQPDATLDGGAGDLYKLQGYRDGSWFDIDDTDSVTIETALHAYNGARKIYKFTDLDYQKFRVNFTRAAQTTGSVTITIYLVACDCPSSSSAGVVGVDAESPTSFSGLMDPNGSSIAQDMIPAGSWDDSWVGCVISLRADDDWDASFGNDKVEIQGEIDGGGFINLTDASGEEMYWQYENTSIERAFLSNKRVLLYVPFGDRINDEATPMGAPFTMLSLNAMRLNFTRDTQTTGRLTWEVHCFKANSEIAAHMHHAMMHKDFALQQSGISCTITASTLFGKVPDGVKGFTVHVIADSSYVGTTAYLQVKGCNYYADAPNAAVINDHLGNAAKTAAFGTTGSTQGKMIQVGRGAALPKYLFFEWQKGDASAGDYVITVRFFS